jgi:hypothetical protein
VLPCQIILVGLMLLVHFSVIILIGANVVKKAGHQEWLVLLSRLRSHQPLDASQRPKFVGSSATDDGLLDERR